VGSYPPEPTLGDIRGSGQIGDLASNVMFVYRHEARRRRRADRPSRAPRATSTSRRSGWGRVGRVDVVFQGSRMRFIEPAEPGTVGTVTIVDSRRRPWLPHDAFDLRSALERGPSNGGVPLPCRGTLQLVGDPHDAALLAVCTSCGYETGVLSQQVESFEDQHQNEREEPWWNR
jgi:hypothetical protein